MVLFRGLLWCLLYSITAAAAAAAATDKFPPLPTARQLEFMELETIQFMHFSIPTSWQPPDSFLRRPNPTYHNCIASWIPDHGWQTEGFYPCLNPKIFNPAKLDTEQWMEASAALGMKEICLTAKHAGGFTMWPSKYTPYGVQSATNFRGGKGDILREFVQSARKWGIKICYYINPMTDGYLVNVANVSKEQFEAKQKGMMREVLTQYGPVSRLCECMSARCIHSMHTPLAAGAGCMHAHRRLRLICECTTTIVRRV
jgi:hypothetical protein